MITLKDKPPIKTKVMFFSECRSEAKRVRAELFNEKIKMKTTENHHKKRRAKKTRELGNGVISNCRQAKLKTGGEKNISQFKILWPKTKRDKLYKRSL